MMRCCTSLWRTKNKNQYHRLAAPPLGQPRANTSVPFGFHAAVHKSLNKRSGRFGCALLFPPAHHPAPVCSTPDSGAFRPPHPVCIITCSSFPPAFACLESTPRFMARGSSRAPDSCAFAVRRIHGGGLAWMTRQLNSHTVHTCGHFFVNHPSNFGVRARATTAHPRCPSTR